MSDDHDLLAFLDYGNEDLADGNDVFGQACERQLSTTNCGQGNVDRRVARLLQELHDIVEGRRQLPGTWYYDDGGLGHFEVVSMCRHRFLQI